jgi:hypothetical protein
MKTIAKVPVSYQMVEDTIPSFESLAERVIYISDKYHCSIHKCLCGCGGQTVMPLNNEKLPNHGWDYSIQDGKISFTPSVGNFQFPCRSHYIITNGVANFV